MILDLIYWNHLCNARCSVDLDCLVVCAPRCLIFHILVHHGTNFGGAQIMNSMVIVLYLDFIEMKFNINSYQFLFTVAVS